MTIGWKQAAVIAALAVGLAAPLTAIAETAANNGAANQGPAGLSDNNMLYSRLPKLADHTAKAERHFQKGDHARGLTYILPYVFAGNMERGRGPGLILPDAEEEIFERSISLAKELDYRDADRSGANYLAFRILAYASLHRDDAKIVRTVLNEWPNFKISVAFRRAVEERYPFIANWRESPGEPRPAKLSNRPIKVERILIQQYAPGQLELYQSQSEDMERQFQQEMDERDREARRREEDRRNEEARRRGLERGQEYARQNEERMRETERQRQEAEWRREEEHRQFAERARQQAEAKAAEERRQMEVIRENTHRMEEDRARREAEEKRRR